MAAVDDLADFLDELAARGGVAITETSERLVINQLTGLQAKRVLELIDAAGWVEPVIADAGGEIGREFLADQLERVRVHVDKPAAPEGVEQVVTNAAFAASLDRPREADRVWVRRLSAPFVSSLVRYAPWGDVEAAPAPSVWPDPRKVVRFLAAPSATQLEIGRWLLADPAAKPVEVDDAYRLWLERAVGALAASLANEVEADGTLIFRGPPLSRVRPTGAGSVDGDAFEALQHAARWVYENPRELENRHGLLAAEVARAALRGGDLSALCEVLAAALEGARIAYNFGVTQQSRDTLKALGDLRKAVADETTKLSESTRGLATAVAGAVFGNIGLIVARLTLPESATFVPVAAMILGAVLTVYVVSIIISGFHFIGLQRDLRSLWRGKLYVFLTDDEYQKMVKGPAERAELGFLVAAVIGGLMSIALLVAVIIIAGTPVPTPGASSADNGRDAASQEVGAASAAAAAAAAAGGSAAVTDPKSPPAAPAAPPQVQTAAPPPALSTPPQSPGPGTNKLSPAETSPAGASSEGKSR